jgi:hypothetical protein
MLVFIHSTIKIQKRKSMAETAPKQYEATASDWDALREGYSGGDTAEKDTRTPETSRESEIKALQLQVKEMQARLSETLDKLAALTAGPEKASTPTTVEAITSAPAGPTEHSPTESYVRDIMPGTVEIDDYKETHRAEMELIAQNRAEAQERAQNARTRKEQRKLARGELKEAYKLERKDRMSKRWDTVKRVGRSGLRKVKNFVVNSFKSKPANGK